MKEISKSKAADTALYIAGMVRELRALATKSDLGFIAYLLSMVEQEADAEVTGKPSLTGKKSSG